ncbi:MAG TPA: hypothetical protein DDW20_00510 [Firmicutes bacterium]|nr:hypothetical protein [Bacillota bacterium]
MNFEKPNNSDHGDLQPYNPENGEYEEKSTNDVYNYYARKLGGSSKDFPLHFQDINYPIEYIHDYLNNEIDWTDLEYDDRKTMFLLDINNSKKRYLIFRENLGYNETNSLILKQQFIENALKYKVFVDKGYDKFGFRVKIYMPIKFFGSNKQLIIKTCWLVSEGKKPKFITAWYDNKFERNLRDEI